MAKKVLIKLGYIPVYLMSSWRIIRSLSNNLVFDTFLENLINLKLYAFC